ncbi:serine hydrolase [Candidatus Latescibacterota bacterium]
MDVPWTSGPADIAGTLDVLEAWMGGQAAQQELPGLSVGVVIGDELVWQRGFGFSDTQARTPADGDTIYRIASISKTFTSTAVLQLRDQGKLRLDDPVHEYLPWFCLDRTSDDGLPVTLRHLLTHTAGLPREAAFPYWSDFQFPTREQLVETLPTQSAAFAPERRFKYSNLGLALAGEVLAAVSGEPYDQYVKRHVLDPLGMSSTTVRLPAEHLSRLATGYSRKLPGQPRQKCPFTDAAAIAPAANLSSTVTDLARFVSLQFRHEPLGGRQILRGSTLREMHRPHWVFADWEGGRGLGFVVYRRNGRTLAGHGGHVAGYRTQILFDPLARVGAIVLINCSGADPLYFAGRALDWLIPSVERSRPEPSAAPFDATWKPYLGRYRNAWADVQVIRQGDRLVLIGPTDDDPIGSAYSLVPQGDGAFLMEGDDGTGCVGELARFELDPDGAVERLQIGVNYTYPVRDWNV